MRLTLFAVICLLSFATSVWGSSSYFIRAASDPVDNLIYPQQLAVCGEGNYHILDTVSNSAHIKIYSSDGEFLSGIIPAGAGKDTAKFDLGLTILSGKKIFDIALDGTIYLYDNEDSVFSIKQFDQRGSRIDSKFLGFPSIIDSYGSVALSGKYFFVEFDSEIYRGNLPLRGDIQRFTGSKNKPIENWNASSSNLVVLDGSNLTVFNKSAMPVSRIDIPNVLGKPSDLDIFGLAISESGVIAITGAIRHGIDLEKPFIATFNTQGSNPQIKFVDKFLTSLTYDSKGFLHIMIVSGKSVQIEQLTPELRTIKTVTIPLGQPSLIHPRKMVVDSDGSIWVDDQYNKSSIENPYDLEGNMSLFLKKFSDGIWKSQEIRSLKLSRFATLFLGEIEQRIIMSGVQVSNEGIPQEVPTYGAKLQNGEISVSILGNESEIVIGRFASESDGNMFLLDTENGDIHVGKIEGNRLMRTRALSSLDFQLEGLPVIESVGGNEVFAQAMASLESSFQSIMRVDISSGKVKSKWLPSDYIDLRLLYVCDDKTSVVHWFPNALFRVDDEFRVLAWIDLSDEASFDFLDGAYREGTNFLLDGRYNIVYSFPNRAWTQVNTFSSTDVYSGMNYLRESIGNYYGRYNHFPATLNDLLRTGICQAGEMDKAFLSFLGESPVYYMGDNFGYSALVWAKDRDHSLYIVSHDGIEEVTR